MSGSAPGSDQSAEVSSQRRWWGRMSAQQVIVITFAVVEAVIIGWAISHVIGRSSQ